MAEVEELKKRRSEEGGEDIEISSEEEEFIVLPIRLLLGAQGLQPSVSACRTPRWNQIENVIGDAPAFLMDFSELEAGRIAPLQGLKSFRGLYPMIAYEDNLKWTEDALHPFLSLPDCDETMFEHARRSMRTASFWELFLHGLTVLFLLEAFLKALVTLDWKWAVGAFLLLGMMLLQSTPFLRVMATFLPAATSAPALPPQ